MTNQKNSLPKVCFVILHYKTWWDTIECVNSILEDEYLNREIILVNNDGDNSSNIHFEKAFKNNSSVIILDTGKNLGFSGGNNYGFRYAKSTSNADFIILSNNDIVINSQNFTHLITSKYKESKYDILGPEIISAVDQHHQNPRFELYHSIENLKKFIPNFRRLLLLSYLRLDIILLKIKKKILPKSHLPSYNNDLNHTDEQWGVKLHGSFWVFSPDYLQKYDGIYPLKSMHMEESFLNYRVNRDNLDTVYYPNCSVIHKEDSATNHVYGKGASKRTFYYKNCLDSCKELLDLMERDIA